MEMDLTGTKNTNEVIKIVQNHFIKKNADLSQDDFKLIVTELSKKELSYVEARSSDQDGVQINSFKLNGRSFSLINLDAHWFLYDRNENKIYNSKESLEGKGEYNAPYNYNDKVNLVKERLKFIYDTGEDPKIINLNLQDDLKGKNKNACLLICSEIALQLSNGDDPETIKPNVSIHNILQNRARIGNMIEDNFDKKLEDQVVISRKPEINPDFCKDLVVINTYGLNKNSDMAKAIQELTGNTNINVPFVPLSTCNRHVYVLSKDLLLREFQSENNNLPILSKLFNSGSRDDTFQIYKGDEAMKWVTTWVSGSLNKGKYCQDTYNKKTVIDRLDIFSKLSNGDNSKKRQEICNELREKINKEVEGINVTEKNSDEKLKWLKEKRENIKSVNDLNPYRILDEQDRNAFCNYVGTIFNMASRITSGLEALKNSDQIKPLWSGLIKKENLDVIKEENVELFKEVMDTRTSFAEEYVKTVFNLAKYNNINYALKEKEPINFIVKSFEPQIQALKDKFEERFKPKVTIVNMESSKLLIQKQNENSIN